MHRGRLVVIGLFLLVPLVAALPAAGRGGSPNPSFPEAPRRFDARAGGAEIPSSGRVRVHITLQRAALLSRALQPRISALMSGVPTKEQLAGMRGGQSRDMALTLESRRHRALASMDDAAGSATAIHERVAATITAAGGRVLEHDVLTGSITASIPAEAARSLEASASVAAIEPVDEGRPQGLDISTASVGAPSFWAAGHLGGRGNADSSPADLAILHDKIEEDHPAFNGVVFQRPSDAPAGTSCGQHVSGCEHGTEVASMAISRGVSNCAGCGASDASNKGVAPSLDSVLDAQSSGMADDTAWALGVGSFGISGARDPAEVMTNSRGSVANSDDTAALHGVDKLISAYGVLIAYPAGNEGPARTVNASCIAYDALCMGGLTPRGTVDPADDVIEDFSSRGPTPGGRKKPDLVAVATSEFANQHWIRDGRLWSGGSGTSLAAPQGAAAAALLAGSGIAAPIAQKAILINSARQGRATPASPMGTQAGWQPDWGWGALDLDGALKELDHLYMREVAGGDAHFYRAAVEGPGDRATIVWNRRALGCIAPGCTTTALTLSNLELEQIDPDTGAVEASSASEIDNVEQVRSPGAGDVIYKVKAASTVDGLAGEPYALAARRQVTPLVTPRPTARVTVSTSEARPGDAVQVSAEITNPSPDLGAEAGSATVEVPPGVELLPGSNPATLPLGTLAPNATAVVTWTVTARGDALNDITVTAHASRYGETFASSGHAAFRSNGTGADPGSAAPPDTAPPVDLPVTPPAFPPVTKSSPTLRIRSVTRRGARVLISGTVASSAWRRLTFEVKGTAGRRRIRHRAQTFPQAGRFKLSLRLPRKLNATLTVRYEGDDALAAAASRVRLRKL